MRSREKKKLVSALLELGMSEPTLPQRLLAAGAASSIAVSRSQHDKLLDELAAALSITLSPEHFPSKPWVECVGVRKIGLRGIRRGLHHCHLHHLMSQPMQQAPDLRGQFWNTLSGWLATRYGLRLWQCSSQEYGEGRRYFSIMSSAISSTMYTRSRSKEWSDMRTHELVVGIEMCYSYIKHKVVIT